MAKALLRNELIIAVDFDGTITDNPDVSDDLQLRPECKRVLTRMYEDGVKLVLWTCRTGIHMDKATAFLQENDLYEVFSAVNEQVREVLHKYPLNARKVGADLYIDDKNFGCSTIDWLAIEDYVYGGI